MESKQHSEGKCRWCFYTTMHYLFLQMRKQKTFHRRKKSGGEGSILKGQKIPLEGIIWKNIIRCALDNVEAMVTHRNNNTTGYIH